MSMQAWDIHIDGIVQGVGFRPFVVRLARELGVTGWVLNNVQGVDVRAWGSEDVLCKFARRIESDAPPAALVASVDVTQLDVGHEADEGAVAAEVGVADAGTATGGEGVAVRESGVPREFSIHASDADGSRSTLVSPDLATCSQCLSELFNPQDRHYRYPFINCTNCGPRFTIINDLPYDRPATSMGCFEMCPDCAVEYGDVLDRRYHAQPNACFECGPRLWGCVSPAFGAVDAGASRVADGAVAAAETGAAVAAAAPVSAEQAHDIVATVQQAAEELSATDARAASDALIAEAASCIIAGEVIAVKGLGGWHLCCDATNAAAVQALRDRKRRPSKPLAVMVADCDAAQELVELSQEEAELLQTPAHPIVLVPRVEGGKIAPNVAGTLPELGVMLPSTPLQHLLLRALGRPVIMTSGNRSGEPIVAGDAEALEALGHIASWFLGNNRAIVARYDDSVARVLANGATQMVRRARGYAPAPLFVEEAPRELPVIFAAGPEQKSTFCLLSGRRAFVSQHLGDLETLGAWNAWQEARERYQRLFGLEPQVFACDMHPEYLSSKWARAQAAQQGLPLLEVQHHHAHIAAVMGENKLHGRVLGVALDGTGYGPDGSIWGCELLLASRSSFERLWHLPQFRLLGGAAAVKDPRRVAFALLYAAGLQDDARFAPFMEVLPNAQLLGQMLAKGLNAPLTNSAGRLFDAVAALMGLCQTAGYDGEPACLLEAKAREELARDGYAALFGMAPTVPQDDAQLLRFLLTGESTAGTPAPHPASADSSPASAGASAATPVTASGVHVRLAATIIDRCVRAKQACGVSAVALGGGCMVNRLLQSLLVQGLQERGFEVYENRELPPNDGCIAYGQAIVAQARLLEE